MARSNSFQPGQDWVWYAPNTKYAYGKEEIDAVKRALENVWLTLGKITTEFERQIANIIGKR